MTGAGAAGGAGVGAAILGGSIALGGAVVFGASMIIARGAPFGASGARVGGGTAPDASGAGAPGAGDGDSGTRARGVGAAGLVDSAGAGVSVTGAAGGVAGTAAVLGLPAWEGGGVRDGCVAAAAVDGGAASAADFVTGEVGDRASTTGTTWRMNTSGTSQRFRSTRTGASSTTALPSTPPRTPPQVRTIAKSVLPRRRTTC